MEASTVVNLINRMKNHLGITETELNYLLNRLTKDANDDFYRLYQDYKNDAVSLFSKLDYLLTQIYETFIDEQHAG